MAALVSTFRSDSYFAGHCNQQVRIDNYQDVSCKTTKYTQINFHPKTKRYQCTEESI